MWSTDDEKKLIWPPRVDEPIVVQDPNEIHRKIVVKKDVQDGEIKIGQMEGGS